MADSKISQLTSGTPTTSDTGVMVQGGVNKKFIFGDLPTPTETQTALNNKVDKETGKGLSTNDYTTTEKNKLAGIEAGAEVNTINSIIAGPNVTIDNTDPLNPVISSTGGGVATSLDDLTDVTITTPTNGQALIYNGTNWVNSTPAGGGDMSKVVYDPQDIEGDAFDRANHTGTQEVSTITVNGNALAWNTDESTLDIPLNANVTLQTGQETLWLGRNNTGSIIPNGTVVYATGTIGASGRITIAPYIADGSIIGMYTLGITTEDIAVGADGFITHFGKVRGFNTSSFTEGTVLYASPTTAGALTPTEPSYPNIRIPLAFVITSHASVGTLAIRVPTVDQNASQVGYDNTTSGLTANNTQDAIDELESGKANDNEVVKLSGNQTIDGVKTFSSSPIVPTPTTDMEVATKKYVDDNSGGGGGGNGPILSAVIAGEITVGTVIEIPVSKTITAGAFRVSLKTLPTGADVIVKLYKNGVEDASVTIATSASATNGLYQGTDTTFVSGSYVAGDVLKASITQIGSTLAGTGLSILLNE